ncbi:rhomboid family intramembrane serine protease [Sphingomicrobium nitratireducens]|uniref:rhomboid family intramembrane serine protease n=1 Tax=Sphingomicrobium nitratireducens TaxID=2964666 RepID=UPI0022403F6D|nr:rhomboid family intramembrane serine protease [Sphingomicrobium nitratireducens]
MTFAALRRTASFWLAIVSVAMLVLTSFMDGESRGNLFVAAGVIPVRLSGFDLPGAVPAWLTPLTSAFLHADWLHLLTNMLLLVWCGLQVERIIGPLRLTALYLLGALGAAIVQWQWDTLSTAPMIGASGAVSAIIGVFSLAYGRPKRVTGQPAADRAIHAAWLLAAWVVIQWMVGVLGEGAGYAIATPAHVGGFVTGLALWPLLKSRPKKDLA